MSSQMSSRMNSQMWKKKNRCESRECIQLDIELQKAKLTIIKLQKRVSEKTAEINRLKASEKRHKLAKCNLVEILGELKNKKWISEEGQQTLNV